MGKRLRRRPVKVVLEFVDPGLAREIGPEVPARLGTPDVTELMAQADAILGVPVVIEGLVRASPHGPEKTEADFASLDRTRAVARHEDAGGALVGIDGELEIRNEQGRGHALDPQAHQSGLDPLVDVHGGAVGPEHPPRIRLRARRERGALQPVGVGVDPLDAVGFEKDVGLEIAARPGEDALARVEVEAQGLAGDPFLSAHEHDVAAGFDPLSRRAVRFCLVEHVEPVGLDPHLAEPEIHESLVMEPALSALLPVGPDSEFVGTEGRLVDHGRGRGRGRRRRGRRGLSDGPGGRRSSLNGGLCRWFWGGRRGRGTGGVLGQRGGRRRQAQNSQDASENHSRKG